MRVILLQAVEGLGEAGATVEVAPGYARNYLVPRGLAEVATAASLARAAEIAATRARRSARELEEARAVAERIDGQPLVVRAKAGPSGRLFGSVTAADVARELERAFGARVDRRRILLADPLRSVGEYPLAVRLHPEVTCRITVRVEPA